MAVPAIGVMGLNALGSFVAKRLGARGFPVMVCDPDPKALQAWMATGGGNPAISAAQLAQASDGLVLAIPASRVIDGMTGLAAGLRPGAVVIDMSGADSLAVQGCARAVASRGALWIEAVPVGVPSRMTVLVGGAEDVVALVAPVIEAVAARVVRVGELGSASLVRALAGTLGAMQLAAYTEALVIARQAGVAPVAALAALAELGDVVGAPPTALQAGLLAGRANSAMRLDEVMAALDQTLAAARAGRLPAPLTAMLREHCAAAALSDVATGDSTDIGRWFASVAKVGLVEE